MVECRNWDSSKMWPKRPVFLQRCCLTHLLEWLQRFESLILLTLINLSDESALMLLNVQCVPSLFYHGCFAFSFKGWRVFKGSSCMQEWIHILFSFFPSQVILIWLLLHICSQCKYTLVSSLKASIIQRNLISLFAKQSLDAGL